MEDIPIRQKEVQRKLPHNISHVGANKGREDGGKDRELVTVLEVRL